MMKSKRDRALEAFHRMAEGGQLTKSNYQPSEKVDTTPDMVDHEMDNLDMSHQSSAPKQDEAADSEDSRSLNQHGEDETGPEGTYCAEGGQITDNYADTEDGDGTDMVGRIMAKRQKMYSEGGKVANEDHGHMDEDLADFDQNEFDDLALRDDLDSSYTGANSGDTDGSAQEDEDRRDAVSRIMKKRAAQSIPKPMRRGM